MGTHKGGAHAIMRVGISVAVLVLVALWSPSTYAADIVSNLSGHWKLDEESGIEASDASGYGNTGTLTYGPTRVAGRLGGAVNFDGADDAIVVGSIGTYANMSAFTLSMWIYPRSTGEGGVGTLLARDNGDVIPVGWRWHMESGNAISLEIGYGTTALSHISSSGSVALNQWNHVVAVWNGGTSMSDIHFYVNGNETGYGSGTDASGSRLSDAGQGLRMGNNTVGSATFNGYIDDARIYTRALSSADVMELFRAAIDTVPPVRYLGSPTGTLLVGTTQVPISFTTGENATCKYSTTAGVKYNDMTTLVPGTGGTTQTFTVTNLENGVAYAYYFRCQDVYGNTNTDDFVISFSIDTATASLDSTAPTVAVTAPSSGAALTGNAILSATASDNVSVAGVSFYVDGVKVGLEDLMVPYSAGWDPASVSSGSHTITAVARDHAGNHATSTPVAVTTESRVGSFNFSLTQGGNRTVVPGYSVSNGISLVVLTGSTNDAIALTVKGLPAGVTHMLSAASCRTSCSIVLTMTANSTAVSGTYPITVQGMGGGVMQATTFNLIVSGSSSASAPPTAGGNMQPFVSYIGRGMRNGDVLRLQQILVSEGFLTADNATGYFGSLTESAVQAFQRKYTIVSSGNPSSTGYGGVGPGTRAKLNERSSGASQAISAPAAALPPTASPVALLALTRNLYHGVRGNDVQSFQEFLVGRGFTTRDNATGYFGSITEAAVKDFQCKEGIVCSGTAATTGWGVVGPKTRSYIESLH